MLLPAHPGGQPSAAAMLTPAVMAIGRPGRPRGDMDVVPPSPSTASPAPIVVVQAAGGSPGAARPGCPEHPAGSVEPFAMEELLGSGELGAQTPELPSAAYSRLSMSNASLGMGMPIRHIITSWRLPEAPGEVPMYVQRAFRLKTFGLLVAQLAAVLCIMLATDRVILTQNWGDSALRKWLFVVLACITPALQLVLVMWRNRVPSNFMLLAVITVLVGIMWGLARPCWDITLHIELLCILLVAMMVTAALLAMLPVKNLGQWSALALSQLTGWLTGSVLELVVASSLGLNLHLSLAASGIALLLFLAMFLLAGHMLVKCNPDDVMRVVVAMDAALIIVAGSIILAFVNAMACCFLEITNITRDGERRRQPQTMPQQATGHRAEGEV